MVVALTFPSFLCCCYCRKDVESGKGSIDGNTKKSVHTCSFLKIIHGSRVISLNAVTTMEKESSDDRLSRQVKRDREGKREREREKRVTINRARSMSVLTRKKKKTNILPGQ